MRTHKRYNHNNKRQNNTNCVVSLHDSFFLLTFASKVITNIN